MITLRELVAKRDRIKITDADVATFKAYKAFVSYCRQIKRMNLHHFLIASHFVYGWMPTMLQISPDAASDKARTADINQALRILNKVKSHTSISSADIESLRKCVNNSLVGTSKLLHFIDPNKYPIWDKKIVASLGLKAHTVSKLAYYECFRTRCFCISKEKGFRSFHKKVQQMLKIRVSPYRAIEFVMWKSSR